MQGNQFISIQDVSTICHIEIAVLREWAEDGLIAVRNRGETEGVAADDLRAVKRMVALYKELGVNKEGIEIIMAMRDRILEMGREVETLQHQLGRLEQDRRLRSLEIPAELGLLIDFDDADE
jgi:DNA-binding transcriptional MerR regulator